MVTSYIIHTLILLYLLSISPNNQLLWKHLMENKVPPTAFLSCFNSRFSECRMLHASMVVQSTSTSFESSLLFPLKSLRSSQFWARSRVNGRSRARLFFVSIFFFLRASNGCPLKRKSWRRGSIPQISEKMHTSCAFSLKTTMPWLSFYKYVLLKKLKSTTIQLWWKCNLAKVK